MELIHVTAAAGDVMSVWGSVNSAIAILFGR